MVQGRVFSSPSGEVVELARCSDFATRLFFASVDIPPKAHQLYRRADLLASGDDLIRHDTGRSCFSASIFAFAIDALHAVGAAISMTLPAAARLRPGSAAYFRLYR